MESISRSPTARDVARLGRACGRVDAQRGSDACALAMVETELWEGWSETMRRLWEYAYHVAQIESAWRAWPS